MGGWADEPNRNRTGTGTGTGLEPNWNRTGTGTEPERHSQVRSIECKRQSVKEVSEGQSATFAVRSVNRRGVALRRSTFRKGMVAIDGQDDPRATREFEADVVILHHSTTVAPGYQPVIHCGVVRQAAAILSMSGTESGMEALRTGQTATVRFRFMVRK